MEKYFKNKESNILNDLCELVSHIPRTRIRRLILIGALTIASAVAELISLGAVLPFLTAVTQPEMLSNQALSVKIMRLVGCNSVEDYVTMTCLLFGVTALVAGAIRYTLLVQQSKIGFSIGSDLACNVVANILGRPYKDHFEIRSSEVVSVVSVKIKDVINQSIFPVLTIASSSVIGVGIIAFLSIVNPIVAFSSFAIFGVVYFIVAVRVRNELAAQGQIIADMQSASVKVVHESLSAVREVILTNSSDYFIDKFNQVDRSARSAAANIHYISQSPRFVLEAIGIALIALSAYLIIVVRKDQVNLITTLGTLGLSAQRLLPLLQQGYLSYSQLHGNQASLRDVLAIIRNPKQKQTNPSQEIDFNRALELNDVSFGYENKAPILVSINLKIEAGTMVGIVGKTGAGKSTLVDLILGLNRPTEGHLKVDGLKITDENLGGWHRNVFYVSQGVYLSDASITENVAFGGALVHLDQQKVVDSCKLAHIHETVLNMPDSYATIVGERGAKLSSGQRQRIGIARAFYRGAKLLVLDEATNALDFETEDSVIRSIKNQKNLTVIVIAHNPSTLRYCDRILEVKNGTLAELCPSDFR